MKHTVRVRCWGGCDDDGMVPDEDGIPRVCPTCMGQRFRDVNPDGPCCDIESHREVEVVTP